MAEGGCWSPKMSKERRIMIRQWAGIEDRLHAIHKDEIQVYPGLQRMRGARLDAAGCEQRVNQYEAHRPRNVSGPSAPEALTLFGPCIISTHGYVSETFQAHCNDRKQTNSSRLLRDGARRLCIIFTQDSLAVALIAHPANHIDSFPAWLTRVPKHQLV